MGEGSARGPRPAFSSSRGCHTRKSTLMRRPESFSHWTAQRLISRVPHRPEQPSTSTGPKATPSVFRLISVTHATRVRQVLSTIARRSDGRVKLQIFNTDPDSDAEWRAVAAGIRRVPLSAGGGFFLGVEVAHGEKRQVFPYLDENRGGQFEYDIALALSRIEQSHVPKVGLLSPLIAPSDMTDAVSKFSFIDALKTAADVAAIPFFAEFFAV